MCPRLIDIWATRDAGSKILRTVELPAKASVHINMQQDFTQRAAELECKRKSNPTLEGIAESC